MRRWPRPDAPGGAHTWPALLVCGVLWGLAITGIETLSEPPAGVSPGLVVRFMASMVGSWSVSGVCWAMATRFAARRPSPGRMVLVWLIGAAILSAGQAALDTAPWLLDATGAVRAVVGPQPRFDALFAHIVWLNSVFGGLYVGGYAAFQRMVRSRRQLARLQRALIDEAALLEEARLHSLRGALQPQILLEAVQALRARYEIDLVSADALLDQLVVYLRAATGVARRWPPAPGDEPRAAKAYRNLLGALAQGPAVPSTPTIPQSLNHRSSS